MDQLLVEKVVDTEQGTKKAYIKPAITHDLELETRAGSVITPFSSPFSEIPKH
jgi:hypothetical protein